ncbi:MAG: methyltransferase domain-containing protein [Gammaproteobacteria bacterium]|nr:methyltransferase domain-containing protein [Gammaproteobacteria bacterium]
MSADNWDAYWQNARSAAAHSDGGPQDEALEKFWLGLFEQVTPTLKSDSLIVDIACGNGAVARFALASLNSNNNIEIVGIDESAAAVLEMRKRSPEITALSASALQLPLRDGVVDFLTSQFGMEYAGSQVLNELMRLLPAGGIMAAVMHMHKGGIYLECEINLQAIEAFRQTHILENFEVLYREVVVTNGRSADKERIQETDRQFAKSVKAVEEILRQRGKGVASETLLRIYRDIGHMYTKLSAYDENEILNWIKVMHSDLASYAGRMSSMLNAALTESDFQKLLLKLEETGFKLRVQDKLMFGERKLPAAWVIVAQREPSN